MLGLWDSTNPRMLYKQLDDYSVNCLNTHIRPSSRLVTSLGHVTACIHQPLVCSTYKQVGTLKGTPVTQSEGELGCVHLLQPASRPLPAHAFNVAVDLYFFIQVERDFVVNVTLFRFHTRHSDFHCVLYHIMVFYLLSPLGPFMGDICARTAFPGDVRSMLSAGHSVAIVIRGYFTIQDSLSITYSKTPTPGGLSATFAYVSPDGWGPHFVANATHEDFPWNVLYFTIRGKMGHKVLIGSPTAGGRPVRAFDGPGPRCPRMTGVRSAEQDVYVSSSPVAVLLVGPDTQHSDHRLSYQAAAFTATERRHREDQCSPRPSFHQSLDETITIRTNYNQQTINYCFWIFKVNESMTPLTIHIAEWQYQGPSDASCSFGGLRVEKYPISYDFLSLCGKMVHESAGFFNLTVKVHTVQGESQVGVEVAVYRPYSTGHVIAEVGLDTEHCFVLPNPCVLGRAHYELGLIEYTRRYHCLRLQQARENGSTEQGDCFLRIRGMSFDLKFEAFNMDCFPEINTGQCKQSHHLFVDRKMVNMSAGYGALDAQGRHEVVVRRDISLLFVRLYMRQGQQMPVFITAYNIQRNLGFTRAGGAHPNSIYISKLPTTGPIISSVRPDNVSKLNTAFRITKVKETEDLSGQVWLQYFLVIFYSGGCPTNCTNDTITIHSGGTLTEQVYWRLVFGERSLWRSTVPIGARPFPLPSTFTISVQVTRAMAATPACGQLRSQCFLHFVPQFIKMRPPSRCSAALPGRDGHLAGNLYSLTSVAPHCYFIPSQPSARHLSWNEANTSCHKLGTELVSLDSLITFSPDEEMAQLQNALWFHQSAASGFAAYIPPTPVFIGLTLTVSSLFMFII